MIILVNPMLSNYRNLNGDSCYIFIKKVVTGLLKKYPDYYFLIPWPHKESGFTYTTDGFFNHPHIIRLPMEMPQRKMDMVVNFPITYWRKLFKIFTPDVVWNHIPEIGHLFKNIYTSFDEKTTSLVVFNQHHYVIHPTLPYPIGPYKAVQFQSYGSYLVDLNIFNSDYCKSMFDDIVRPFGEAKNIKYEIVKFALIENDYPEPTPDKEIRIAYNHRLQDYKNYLDTFETLDMLYKNGHKFKVMVTNPNASNFNKLVNYPFVEGMQIANHSEYLKELGRCHINTINSQHETFCISALESLAFGQVLVAPRAITFPELVSPDYKYLFNNEEEQYKMLSELIKNPALLDAERPKIRQYTKENYGVDKFVDKYHQLFTDYSVNDISADNLKDTSKAAFSKIFQQKGFIELKEVQKQLGEFNLGWQAFPLLKIKRLLNNLGYKDEIRGLKQGFLIG